MPRAGPAVGHTAPRVRHGETEIKAAEEAIAENLPLGSCFQPSGSCAVTARKFSSGSGSQIRWCLSEIWGLMRLKTQVFPVRCYSFLDVLFGDRKIISASLALGTIIIRCELILEFKSTWV